MVTGRVLDPGTALSVKGVRPRSTVYVGPRLIVSVTPDTPQVIERLQAVAESLGWVATVHAEDQERARPSTRARVGPARRPARPGGEGREGHARTRRLGAAPERAGPLRHRGDEPGRARPHRADPLASTRTRSTLAARSTPRSPFHCPAHSSAGRPRERRPAVVLLRRAGQRWSPADDVRRTRPACAVPTTRSSGRRPVVATLDTGCGKHAWLAAVVKHGPALDGQPIGYVDDATDPEKWFDQVGRPRRRHRRRWPATAPSSRA